MLDNESKERALVGEVISTVALAGQICREFNVSDHGIDMEIEFKDGRRRGDGSEAVSPIEVGRFLSCASEQSDGAEIFRIKDQRHARYWMDQGVSRAAGDPKLQG